MKGYGKILSMNKKVKRVNTSKALLEFYMVHNHTFDEAFSILIRSFCDIKKGEGGGVILYKCS